MSTEGQHAREVVHARSGDGRRWVLLPDGTYRGMTAAEARADDARWLLLPGGRYRRLTQGELRGAPLPEGALAVPELWLALPDGTSRAMTEAECVEGAPLPDGAGSVAPPVRDAASASRLQAPKARRIAVGVLRQTEYSGEEDGG